MKILITGYTTRMTDSVVRMDYVTFSYVLAEILRGMGHEVDHRKVLIGERLSSVYDFAFCGLAPLNSMTSSRVCETHYALESMRGRCAVYADDWSFCGFGDSVRYTLDKWDKYLAYKKFPYDSRVIEDTKKSLEGMMENSEGNNAPILAPMFTWGDHKLLMANKTALGNYSAKLITVDPSRWVKYPTIDIPRPLDRIRRWVMAALADHSPWIKRQRFKLPVHYVGNKRMEGCLVLTERETIKLFANSFGVISVGYPSAGSGWWRTRYLNCSWAEGIIYSDPRDTETMGSFYRGTPDTFESILTEQEYLDISQGQTNWLENNLSSKETVQVIIERLLAK